MSLDILVNCALVASSILLSVMIFYTTTRTGFDTLIFKVIPFFVTILDVVVVLKRLALI